VLYSCDIYIYIYHSVLHIFWHDVINDAIVIQMSTDDTGVLQKQLIIIKFLVTGFPVDLLQCSRITDFHAHLTCIPVLHLAVSRSVMSALASCIQL